MKSLIAGFIKGMLTVFIIFGLLIWGIHSAHAECFTSDMEQVPCPVKPEYYIPPVKKTFNLPLCKIKLQERENQAAYLEYFQYNVANGIPKLSVKDMKRNLDDLAARQRKLYDTPIPECTQ